MRTGTMPRYYFHTKDGRCILDAEGSELADLRAARIEAIKVLSELLHESPEEFWETRSFSVTVSDKDRLTLFEVDVCATDAPGAAIRRA